MSFFSFLQKNRLFIHYLTIILILLGLLALTKLNRESRPNVNFNRVVVSVVYPGASPKDVEELLIDPLEEKISEVDGIEEYRSVSYSGAGSISVKIDDEYPNVEEIVDEIRRKVAEVKDFPDGVDDPFVTEAKAENIPVLKMALYGDLDVTTMKMEVEKLKDYLKTFDDVQSVNYSGINDLQFQILTYPEKLYRYDITLAEIISNLGLWSRQRPGGLLENRKEAANVMVGINHDTLESIKNRVLRSNADGNAVVIQDIAKVELTTEKQNEYSLFGDKNAVLLTIVKKPHADVITTVETVKNALQNYTKSFPDGLRYKFYTDESIRVRNRLNIVASNAIFGLALVVILLVLFLDWRSAIVTSLGLPVAILGGIFVIFLLGQTLNSLVLVGIVIVLGMLVDDAIVVCENIYAYIESGKSPFEAALLGVREIAVPVLATVLTTVFAFFPIIFMKGIMGQFLSVIPITVISMLLFSLFEALVILPVHSAEVMKKHQNKTSAFLRFEKAYHKFLKWSLKHRVLIMGSLLIFIAVSAWQGKVLFNGFTLFPAKGLNGLSVRVEAEKNSPLDQTQIYIKELSNQLAAVSEESFDSLYSTIGEVTTGGAGGSRQYASNLAMIEIVFTTDPSFDLAKEKRVVSRIQDVIKNYTTQNPVKASITLDREGPPIGKPIQLQLTARDFSKSEAVAEILKEEFQKMTGVYGLETDFDKSTKSYRFTINNELALADGISPTVISQTLFAATTGVVSQEVLKDSQKVELLVGVANGENLDVSQVLNLRVRNKYNQDVIIKNYVTLTEEFGSSSIQRLNGLRTLTLFGEVDEKSISGKEANKKIQPVMAELKESYPDVIISTGGGEKERMEALSDTMRLYVLAIIMIFMVISLSFQSIYYPFLVLVAIPMGLSGVVWALKLHGQPMSLMSLIGIVGLSGVVINVSIVLLKFVQESIASGKTVDEAIVEAGTRRFRPIVITTLTTLLGLAPTIYGIGGVDNFVQPIALVLGWGLLVGTLLTLFVLPSFVSIALKIRR